MFGVAEWGTVVVLDDGDGRGTRGGGGGGGSGGGKRAVDGLRLNRGSRFGHARAAVADGHAPTLYYQTKREVHAPQ